MITQSPVTVMADILPGHEAPLRMLLEEEGRDIAHNRLIPFGNFLNIHFARFFIMDVTQDLDGRPFSPTVATLIAFASGTLAMMASSNHLANCMIGSACTSVSDRLARLYSLRRSATGRKRAYRHSVSRGCRACFTGSRS